MMDEVDKIGADYRGDPSSALLEVLDPEQNNSFRDHYLGVPFDLSQRDVHLHGQPHRHHPGRLPRPHGGDPPLRLHRGGEGRDRQAPHRAQAARGARPHPGAPASSPTRRCAPSSTATRARRGCGTSSARSPPSARKVARKVAEGHDGHGEDHPRVARASTWARPRSCPRRSSRRTQVGIATGLAWTATGGDVMFIEATAMKGKGRLTLTGQLGDVMKESAQAALVLRAHAAPGSSGSSEDFFATHDLHVHVPEGAIPKDGPSAGITMATAMISVFTEPAGAPLRGHDRRDHAARQRAAHRRPEGEDPGRPARRASPPSSAPKLNKKELDEMPATSSAAWRSTWWTRWTRCWPWPSCPSPRATKAPAPPPRRRRGPSGPSRDDRSSSRASPPGRPRARA